MDVVRMTASDLRHKAADIINRVGFGGERIVVERNGRDVIAIVSLEDLRVLEELEAREDEIDVAEAQRILATFDPAETVSLEEAKAKLGRSELSHVG